MTIKYQEIILQLVEVHEVSRVVHVEKSSPKKPIPKKPKSDKAPNERHLEANRKWAAKRYADPVKRDEYLKYLSDWRKANRDKVNAMRKRKRDRDRLHSQRGSGSDDGSGRKASGGSGSGLEEVRRSERETIPIRRTGKSTTEG